VTTLAYVDCVGGLAGDMLLGALLDAGAPEGALHDVVSALGLDDVKVAVDRASGAIRAVRVTVEVGDGPPDRRAAELLSLVASAPLPERVRARSLSALSRLADVEAEIHGVARDEVVLHELGGVDTLVDVVGAFALLESLGVEDVVCSPVPYARGVIQTRHGAIPGPGPAVVALLRGAAMHGVESQTELVTPTGAAIVAEAASAFGELPSMRVEAVGYGVGARASVERPNVVRVVTGTREDEPVTRDVAIARREEGSTPRDVVLLETHVDDLLPELVPDLLEACREAGALDVWTAPVSMKKGRTGIAISAVARPDAERAVARAMFEHGSTLGVRVSRIRRYELDREIREVTVQGRAIRVKLGLLEGRVVNVAPEHDDCARVAAETGRTVKDVWASALSAASEIARADGADAR
jgi:pyridinium-3,5-bisthiocarboxylic acid mononucleotide nickel chelatase